MMNSKPSRLTSLTVDFGILMCLANRRCLLRALGIASDALKLGTPYPKFGPARKTTLRVLLSRAPGFVHGYALRRLQFQLFCSLSRPCL